MDIEENSQNPYDDDENTEVDNPQIRPNINLFQRNYTVPETQHVLVENTEQDEEELAFTDKDVNVKNAKLIVGVYLNIKNNEQLATTKLHELCKTFKISFMKSNNRIALCNAIAKFMVRNNIVKVMAKKPTLKDIIVEKRAL